MNKNYTPGTWEKSINMGGDPIIVAGNKLVCQLNPYLDKDANHSLISAAPDLVEALIDQGRSLASKHWHSKAMFRPADMATVKNHDAFVDTQWKNFLEPKAIAALTKAGVLTKDK